MHVQKMRANKGFLNNIIKVSFSNLISLFSGVLVGFLVPKMMGLDGYAYYKIYTLYLTYIALLSFGVGDGLYLRFSGTDKDKLNVQQLRHYLHVYYVQLVAFSAIAFLCACIFARGEYRFIMIALAMIILPSQITAIHQNLSIITSRFNEYSTRVVTKSILTSVLVLVLFVLYRLNGSEIAYQIYIIGVVAIDYVLAIWYMITYKDINFSKSTGKIKYNLKYKDLIYMGFPLLLSNMAGTIFLNLDRQFVSVLFIHKDYAIYAFAYNLLTLITTMASAVSIVIFPSLKKIQNIDVKKEFSKHFTLFTIIIPLSLLVYFPLCFVVSVFFPKYYLSLEVFRIVLPGIMLSASVSVVFINYYKIENRIKTYFAKTVGSILVSAVLNYFVYLVFKSYESISWASIVALLTWYLLALSYFVKKYNITWKKNTCYVLCCMVLFYLITTIIHNNVVCFFFFAVVLLLLMFLFYRNEIKHFFQTNKIKG